jgi:hypothetical protein
MPLPVDGTSKILLGVVYHTEFGHSLRDTFALTWREVESKLECRLTRRELLEELTYELA